MSNVMSKRQTKQTNDSRSTYKINGHNCKLSYYLSKSDGNNNINQLFTYSKSISREQ